MTAAASNSNEEKKEKKKKRKKEPGRTNKRQLGVSDWCKSTAGFRRLRVDARCVLQGRHEGHACRNQAPAQHSQRGLPTEAGIHRARGDVAGRCVLARLGTC